jgi:hypothetical protein
MPGRAARHQHADAAPAPVSREVIEAALAQREASARIHAARIGRLAAAIAAGDFSLDNVRNISLALLPLTDDLVSIRQGVECSARHEACGEVAA